MLFAKIPIALMALHSSLVRCDIGTLAVTGTTATVDKLDDVIVDTVCDKIIMTGYNRIILTWTGG